VTHKEVYHDRRCNHRTSDAADVEAEVDNNRDSVLVRIGSRIYLPLAFRNLGPQGRVMAAPAIERYTFGRIVIDGRRYLRDLIIYPDRVAEAWRRGGGHTVSPADLTGVLGASPEVLIIGRGFFGRVSVPAEVREALRAAGVEVIAEPTGRACRTYNRLRETQRVAAALHLSC
jgi:hypothetical protein